MYRLHCRDLRYYHCEHLGHEVTGDTKEATWERMVQLGKIQHPDEIADLNGEMHEDVKKKAFEIMSAQNKPEPEDSNSNNHPQT